MDQYEIELQEFRPADEIQMTYKDRNSCGYNFIATAGHGYLIVPTNDKNYAIARKIASYGYIGEHAIYLEEDCEAPTFIMRTQPTEQQRVKDSGRF